MFWLEVLYIGINIFCNTKIHILTDNKNTLKRFELEQKPIIQKNPQKTQPAKQTNKKKTDKEAQTLLQYQLF